ncbi:MAG: molybdopterin-dependent oxidoreductase [Chloroflexi bacterium]|nr:molybdopterin-dependent oxidoreductase [Chloroflexota bacterium]
MQIQFTLNGQIKSLDCAPNETLLSALRRIGCWSVKHGCEDGACGACTILFDGKPVASCVVLAAQAAGHFVVTLESLAGTNELHPIQQAFIETGAIQCGYCTPAMILAAKNLLDANPAPTEADARNALSGVLCRCTGYAKPVQAILRAAEKIREGAGAQGRAGEIAFSFTVPPQSDDSPTHPLAHAPTLLKTQLPTMIVAATESRVVGKSEPKVDALKLAKGKPVFTDDITLPGMLYAALLTSPHAHARIKHIDSVRARALPGVRAVLTYENIPRVIYATGGQSHPNPKPWDQVSLDSKVRNVGDRVAVVAAESPEIAQRALELIEVDYEILPAIFDPGDAMRDGAPIIHDEPDALGIADAAHNLAATVHAVVGEFERGLAEADRVFERTYRVHQVQQAAIEPHVCITYWDEDERLVVRTSTQVPFHVRRMLSPLLGLPVKRIRVIKPRVGGGFGGKQEMLIEDLCAHLTLATNRPVRFEYTRALEFTSARSRHPQTITYRAGVMNDGSLRALAMNIVEDTGAYGTHGLTVCTVSGLRGLSTYRCPNMLLDAKIAYTNKPTPGAFRGYGAPQAEFALESLMEEIARAMNFDPIGFRLQNAVRVGDGLALAVALGEAREGFEQKIQTCALPECVEQGAEAIGWRGIRHGDAAMRRRGEFAESKIENRKSKIKTGQGMAVCMHGTAIAGLDMGAASIKMNDDGSFNILVGATDLGTGSDTVLAQIAAETLGVPTADVIMYSSDTDMTPFDTGAYASSTTFISGGAVKKAADDVRAQIIERAAKMLNISQQSSVNSQQWNLLDRQVIAPDGRSVSLAEIALHSLHTEDQKQIMASASHMSFVSPPPFGAQFAEVEVDTETGQIVVKKLVMAVDCGTAINPQTALGQIEGGMTQALGYAVCEEMVYREDGSLLTTDLNDYHIFRADEMPELKAILVPTYEPSGPFGAKAVAEIPMDGVAPAIANAIYDAVGVRIRDLPITPEKIWRELKRKT